MGAFGHMQPMLHCATALREKGHEVYIITNGSDNMRAKTPAMAAKIGAKMEFTECGLDYDRDLLRHPTHSGEFPLDTFLRKWHPHVK